MRIIDVHSGPYPDPDKEGRFIVVCRVVYPESDKYEDEEFHFDSFDAAYSFMYDQPKRINYDSQGV
jgi:hypothetical protein